MTKKQANLTIDSGAKPGTRSLADIVTGRYDIILKLYNSLEKLLSDSVKRTEDIVDISTSTAGPRKSGTTVYGTHLLISGKAVSAHFVFVNPDALELCNEKVYSLVNLPLGDRSNTSNRVSGSNPFL